MCLAGGQDLSSSFDPISEQTLHVQARTNMVHSFSLDTYLTISIPFPPVQLLPATC